MGHGNPQGFAFAAVLSKWTAYFMIIMTTDDEDAKELGMNVVVVCR